MPKEDVMPIITIVYGTYCNAEPMIKAMVDTSGYRMVDDNEIIAIACSESGMGESKFDIN